MSFQVQVINDFSQKVGSYEERQRSVEKKRLGWTLFFPSTYHWFSLYFSNGDVREQQGKSSKKSCSSKKRQDDQISKNFAQIFTVYL